MVRVIAWRTAAPWSRYELEGSAAPEQVLASDHAIPPPLPEEPLATIQRVFDAIDGAARGSGLSVRGSFSWVTWRRSMVVWGAEVTAVPDLDRSRFAKYDGSWDWPWGDIVWSDPTRSTFLQASSDWDLRLREILAWGTAAERCLHAVDAALDADDLWR